MFEAAAMVVFDDCRINYLPQWKAANRVSGMESNGPKSPSTPDEARQALDAVSAAQNLLVERAPIPWWYHIGMALGLGIAISPFSMSSTLPTFLVPIGFILVPFALAWLAGTMTGVRFDFYRVTPSAVAPGWKWAGIFVALVIAGAVLQWSFGLPWAMAAAGTGVFAATVIYSPRVTTAMLEDFRLGRSSR